MYLCEECENPISGFLLSKEIKKSKSKYYKLFAETEDPRNRGDLSLFAYGFLENLLSLFTDSKDHAKRQIRELENLCTYWRATLKDLSNTEDGILQILCQATLFSDFGIDVSDIAKGFDISEKTVNRTLDRFSSLGIIKKNRYGRKIYYRLVSDGK